MKLSRFALIKHRNLNAFARSFMALCLSGALLTAPVPSFAKNKHHHHAAAGQSQIGIASFYGKKFQGRRTANGETFNNTDFTAAHLTLPFGTKVKVTCLRNGRSVIVRINDRGPHVRGRIIDLSVAAAKKIGIVSRGTAKVKLEVVV